MEVKLVFSDFCGKCGTWERSVDHNKLTAPEETYHAFVRVPLNFDEWRKELAEALKEKHKFDPTMKHGFSTPDKACGICWAISALLSGLNEKAKEE